MPAPSPTNSTYSVFTEILHFHKCVWYLQRVQIVVTRFRNGAELLARYQASLAYGGLFVPTRRLFDPGEPVILDVRMPELKDTLLIRGHVAWTRRGRIKTHVRAGFGVEFCDTEQQKRDFLLALARGHRHQTTARRHKRLPIDLTGGWRMLKDTSWHACKVTDIGSGGAFVQTVTLLPKGTAVVLEVTPPGQETTQSLEGRVAWSRDIPGAQGFGVEFRCRDMVGKHRIRELIRRLEQQAA